MSSAARNRISSRRSSDVLFPKPPLTRQKFLWNTKAHSILFMCRWNFMTGRPFVWFNFALKQKIQIMILNIRNGISFKELTFCINGFSYNEFSWNPTKFFQQLIFLDSKEFRFEFGHLNSPIFHKIFFSNRFWNFWCHLKFRQELF